MTAFHPPGHVGVVYHPSVRGAEAVADALARQAAERGLYSRVASLPDDGDVGERIDGIDLLVCVGGDGTVLRASAYAAQADIPIFGVRMGRLGFLTESVEERATEDFARVLDGDARLERRALVQACLDGQEPQHALNDVVIGRARLGRTVSVVAHIDGVVVAEYRADAVVVSTATGSTGYSLSVGGPILYPSSGDIILVPVAPHLTRQNALVLPGETSLRLSVQRGFEAVLSVDGIHHRSVDSGAVVEVTRSPRTASFVRLGSENDFYHNLARRLGWLRSDHVVDEPPGLDLLPVEPEE